MGVRDVDIPGSTVEDVARSYLFDGSALTRLEAFARIDWLHQPDELGRACDGCGQTVPCKTRRLLDGDRA